MRRSAWIGVATAFIVIAGGWWYLNPSTAPATSTAIPISWDQETQQAVPAVVAQQNSNGAAQTSATPATDNSAIPNAAFDQNSLVATSSQPTITGTASNVTTVKVEIWHPDSAAQGGLAWWTGMVVPVVNGTWTASLAEGSDATSISSGSYSVDILDWDNAGSHPVQLAHGTLTLGGPQADQAVTAHNQGDQMTATPTAANTWQFTFGGPFAEQQQSYTLDYGDGAQASVQCQTPATDGQPVCDQFAPLTHKYAKAGTYRAQLLVTFVGVGPGNEETTTLLSVHLSN